MLAAVNSHVPWAENVHSEGYQTLTSAHALRHQPVIVLVHVNQQTSGDARPFAEHNYLRYFRKIYESKGWTTVQCTPVSDVTTSEEECGRAVQHVLACLETRGLHQSPIVLHLLGPRTVSVYNEFTRAVKKESDDLFQIRGSIIDSAPSRPAGVGASLRKTFPTVFSIYMAFLHILAAIFPEFFRFPADFDCYEQFCYNKNGSPQLFLYSDCDHVVDSADVEHAINIRCEAGVPVDKRCWGDSDHARHLFSHEEEYTSLCQNFVDRIVRSL